MSLNLVQILYMQLLNTKLMETSKDEGTLLFRLIHSAYYKAFQLRF